MPKKAFLTICGIFFRIRNFAHLAFPPSFLLPGPEYLRMVAWISARKAPPPQPRQFSPAVLPFPLHFTWAGKRFHLWNADCARIPESSKFCRKFLNLLDEACRNFWTNSKISTDRSQWLVAGSHANFGPQFHHAPNLGARIWNSFAKNSCICAPSVFWCATEILRWCSKFEGQIDAR